MERWIQEQINRRSGVFLMLEPPLVSPTRPHHPHPGSSLLVTLKLRLNSYCCFASDPFSAVIRFSKQPLTVRSP